MSKLSLRNSSVLFLLLAVAAPAMALNVVNTSSPSVNCIFNTTCSITVTEKIGPFLSNSYVQSRYTQGQPGSTAAGKWLYLYRIDMRDEVGVVNIPYVTGLRVPFQGLRQYDFNFDAVATDHVFNITSGAMGSKGVTSANLAFGALTFNLSTVYGGSYPGNGESSYYFGVVSDYGPRAQYATIYTSSGSQSVVVWAPYNP